MRWTRWIAGTSFTAAAIAATVLLIAAAPATTEKSAKGATAAKGAAGEKGAKSKQVERGEYLVTIMGCNDCHTPGVFYGDPDFSRRLAGSEIGWKGPWGVSFARNLTPDLDTGIGYWTEDQIVASLRTGMRPDGGVLVPPMPWQDFSRLTDADAHAIAAYLMSLPPIAHEVPAKIAPGAQANGTFVEFPPPSAWDAPRHPPAGGGDKK